MTRTQAIRQRLRSGEYQSDVARALGISRQRVGQVAMALRDEGVTITNNRRGGRRSDRFGVRHEAAVRREAQCKALFLLGFRVGEIVDILDLPNPGVVSNAVRRPLEGFA